ncbi:MAG: hypothetical protein GTN40_00180, partial [Candidatus Aenigmarchaeota archaeon]|nr:hypothetical protein [Candidatus Aenigmarchaeota archaeon]
MGRIRSTFTETNIRLFSIIFLILLILGAVYWYFDQKRVVIKVGDRTVTKTEFNHKLAQYKKFISFTTKDNKDLKKTQLKTAAKDTAEKITEYLILKEEAEKRNISISSEEIDSELKYITQLYSSEDEYKKAIATAYDWTVDDTKQTIETRLLKKKLAPYILSYWSGTYVYMRYDVPLKEGMELIESDRIAKERMNSYYSRLQAGESFDKISEEAMSDPEYKYPNLWASYFKEISEEKSLSNQSEMEAITKLSQNGDSNVIKSEGGYYAIFKATEVGGGKYKSWDSFFDSYKKTNQVKE